MKLLAENLLPILFIILFPVISNCQINNASINLVALEGTWYINYSDFPMWLKGDKTSPSFNYTILNKNNTSYLIDKVTFIKNGKVKSIDGFDKPLNKNNTSFEWRGKGLLKILKSKWRIIYYDEENNWAIIFFEKTLFTPEGYDVISRKNKLSEVQKSLINQKLIEFNIQKELVEIIHP